MPHDRMSSRLSPLREVAARNACGAASDVSAVFAVETRATRRLPVQRVGRHGRSCWFRRPSSSPCRAWEFAAARFIDPFFWSQPSAIWKTPDRLLHRRRPSLTSPTRSAPRFSASCSGPRPARCSVFVLVVAQLRQDRTALRHLLRVDSEAGAGAADHPRFRHGAGIEGCHRDGADDHRFGLDDFCRRPGGRPRSASGCSIRWAPAAGRCSASSWCRVLPWTISVLRVNIGLALTGSIVGEFVSSQHGLGREFLCRLDL